ncbi:MAG: sugar ABC transporter permease [Candidatus Parcubacteria bacterium]|nr:MAG: sugar ABC transporter permease [Candidatus Parcubacteria bacterium]
MRLSFVTIKYLPLIKKLSLREIKARYKQSFLGFLWVVLTPLFQMLIFNFVFSNIISVSHLKVPYAVFVYFSLLFWNFFANCLNYSVNVLVADASLIKKIYFPREIIVLSSVLAKLFDFLISFSMFFVLAFYYKVSFQLSFLLILPVFFLQFIFVYSLSLIFAVLNAYYRDFQYLLNLLVNLWFYLTPIVYSVDMFPEKFRWIFYLNPMAVFIEYYRSVVFNSSFFKLTDLFFMAFFVFSLYFFSYFIFNKLQKYLADVL